MDLSWTFIIFLFCFYAVDRILDIRHFVSDKIKLNICIWPQVLL